MPPPQRAPLIAGVVVGSIALGLLFATLVFYLVYLYRQPRRIQEVTLSPARCRQKPSLDYSIYFSAAEKRPLCSDLPAFVVAADNKDSTLLSPTTPQWLKSPRLLPPPTPVLHPNHARAAGHRIDATDSYPASTTIPSSPLLLCYSLSSCSIPSWRESSVTLFEEDIQLIGLGLQQDVAVEAGGSGAHVSKLI
ncbi:hypothetical protein IQ06DRAFT_299186 [Phaeosphaeriaceae sp. SRC1lsM3a]|nr:hypothetical protein IQ06DRAFT_299186 [Stagonospora sp. SRC1lsM3a]